MAGLVERTQVGKREDLSDKMHLAAMPETPFTTLAPKLDPITNMLFSWTVDKLDDVNMDGVPDGQDVTNHENHGKDRKLLSGRAQWFRRSPMVGKIAQVVSNVAGVGKKKELAKAIA